MFLGEQEHEFVAGFDLEPGERQFGVSLEQCVTVVTDLHDKQAAVKAAFDEKDLANLKFFANIPAGLEDMEGKALERIKAATSN